MSPGNARKPSASTSGQSGGSRSQGRAKGGTRPRQSIRRPAVLADRESMRLQKFLAAAGVDSRRNCETFIREGRVTVDGDVISDPARSINPEEQLIELDGEKLQLPKYRYYLINKPKGVVCTNRDPAGRPRAVDLVPSSDQRLFTVGRLDENTVGLLLITNDGALAEQLAHPRYQVVRKYRVQVAGLPEPTTLAELKQGMHFSDGFFRFHSIKTLKRKGRSTFLELELQEGKNREIRRLLARAGHKVMHLERVAFGPLRLGRLEPGASRELRPQEIRDLYAFIESPPAKRNSRPKRPSGASVRKKKKAAKKASERPSGGNRRGAARHGIAKKKPAKKKKSVGKGNGRGRKR